MAIGDKLFRFLRTWPYMPLVGSSCRRPPPRCHRSMTRLIIASAIAQDADDGSPPVRPAVMSCHRILDTRGTVCIPCREA